MMSPYNQSQSPNIALNRVQQPIYYSQSVQPTTLQFIQPITTPYANPCSIYDLSWLLDIGATHDITANPLNLGVKTDLHVMNNSKYRMVLDFKLHILVCYQSHLHITQRNNLFF